MSINSSNMDHHSKQVVINQGSSEPKSITLISPCIDDNSNLSRHSSSSHSVTTEKEQPSSTTTVIANTEADH